MANPQQKPAGFVPDGFEPDEPVAAPAVAPQRSLLGDAAQVGIGFAKGAGATGAHLLEMASGAGLVPGVRPSLHGVFSTEDERNPMIRRMEEATTAQNPQQLAGKFAEGVAEMAMPTGQAMNAIPRAARAGRAFQDVMGAAKNIPINAELPGQVGLRIMQLAERGGSMPMAVNKFLRRITDPEKAPMVYEEARDFASNISRLSANEFQRLTPAVAREVSELRVVLNRAVADAAGAAGKGREYAQAMNEYAKAMKLRGLVQSAVEGAKKAVPYGLGAGAAGAAGYWFTKQMGDLLGGGD